jgi:hypothetical protein
MVMVAEISDAIRKFVDQWDEQVDEFHERCDEVRRLGEEAEEILAKLKTLQEQCSAFAGDPGGEHLQPIAESELDGIVIEEPRWISVASRPYWAGPLVPIEDETDEDEQQGPGEENKEAAP